MFKCKKSCCSVSFKNVRIAAFLHQLLTLGLEVFLVYSSCQVLSVYPANEMFIGLFLMSFFSVLVLGVSCVLTFIIKNFFSKRVKIAYASVILALLALSGSHLYFAIMISTLKDYLLNQLSLCQNSTIFAELYWSYLKIESVCNGSLKNCACLSESSCSSQMIQAFYINFQCDGLCGTGNNDCSDDISNLITKIGVILAGVTSLSFVFLMISTVLTVCLIKKRMSERSILEIRAKNLQSFDGVIGRDRVDMQSIADENQREEQGRIENLSEIRKVEDANNADISQISIIF